MAWLCANAIKVNVDNMLFTVIITFSRIHMHDVITSPRREFQTLDIQINNYVLPLLFVLS